MNINTTFFFLFTFTTFLMGMSVGMISQSISIQLSLREDMVKHNHASYVVDPSTGQTRFVIEEEELSYLNSKVN